MMNWPTRPVEYLHYTIIIMHLSQEEEYATELDLRLHLHEPRQARITQDIHNVRASQSSKPNDHW